MRKEEIETMLERVDDSIKLLTRTVYSLKKVKEKMEFETEGPPRYKNFDEMKKYWEGVTIEETTLNSAICEVMKLMLKEYNTFESLHEKLEKSRKEKFPHRSDLSTIKEIMSHYRWLGKNGYTIHLNKHCKFKITGYVRPQ